MSNLGLKPMSVALAELCMIASSHADNSEGIAKKATSLLKADHNKPLFYTCSYCMLSRDVKKFPVRMYFNESGKDDEILYFYLGFDSNSQLVVKSTDLKYYNELFALITEEFERVKEILETETDSGQLVALFNAIRNNQHFQDPDKPTPRHLQLFYADIPEPVWSGKGRKPISTAELKERIKDGPKGLTGKDRSNYDRSLRILAERSLNQNNTVKPTL